MSSKKILRQGWWLLLLLLLWLGPAGAEEARLRLLHVNDFHGHAQPYTPAGAKAPVGGAAFMAREVKALRQEAPTLLLAAGDMIHGDNWANLFKGASVIELMNVMGFDAMVVGNHEFEYGPAVLEELIAQAKFPVLGANVKGVRGLKPYVIVNRGNLRVGLIGLVTPDTAKWVHPRNVAGLEFTDPAAAVARAVAELKDKTDLIVVLSHLGLEEDRRLAAQAPGVAVIVGGHSHTRMDKPEVVNGVILVQAYEHGKFLGVLDLTWRDGRLGHFDGRLVPIRPAPGQEEPETAKVVARYQSRVDALLGEVVGRSEVELDGSEAALRTGDTNLGNLVADVVRQVAGAQAALINSGSIKRSIRPGPVRRAEVYAALPFDSYIVALRLTGGELLEALEHGVAAVEKRSGRFPQVSGLRFTYDPKAPPGRRIKEVFIGDRPLQPRQEYTVATYDFLAAGGDGYQVFARALGAQDRMVNKYDLPRSPKLVYNHPGRFIRDEVVDYLKAHPTLPAAPPGRIRRVE